MSPPITVIALCFNHARFLVSCLESVRAQTCQDFQLIVCDDCSRDQSQSLISEWLSCHYPDALFIRHSRNVGLCPTLNEALSHATGRYVSMIATDDSWEPEKLAQQLAAFERLSNDVAVLYSDAHQMNEAGQRLPMSFMQAHAVTGDAPRGRIFSRIADGNFIPAMATLIRLEALRAVGGYDESLTYEDFDMWLRLADRYSFEFVPGKLANYRLVATSMVRTIFDNPTPAHAYSIFAIARKWLETDRLSPVQRQNWALRQASAAYVLYCHNDQRAAVCLFESFRRTGLLRYAALAATQRVGLTRQRLKRLARVFGHTTP